MFGLGIWELIIIIVAVVIFVKPEDLPKFFRKVGKLYGDLKRYNDEILQKFRSMDEKVKKPLTAFKSEFEKAVNAPGEDSKPLQDVHEEISNKKGNGI